MTTPHRSLLLDSLDQLDNPRALVLGDLILDEYIWGTTERVSQEAPSLVMKTDRREHRLGGAANVCHMLRNLGAAVSCAGVIGDDSAGRQLRRQLRANGISDQLVICDPTRPTTCKQRFLATHGTQSAQQILRVDQEEQASISASLQTQLIEQIRSCIASHDVLVISDYGKGFCPAPLVRAALSAAHQRGLASLVDPRADRDFSRYRGATLIKPNRWETELTTATRIRMPQDALRIGAELCQQYQFSQAVITLDRDGMALVDAQGNGNLFTAHSPTVTELTGAGDMVLAVLSVCLASDIAPQVGAQLANLAAGLEVTRQGPSSIGCDDLRRELLAHDPWQHPKNLGLPALIEHLGRHRLEGKKIVFTNGCFDLLHAGHVACLSEAASLGDILVVGMNSDSSIGQLKGPDRPLISERERAAMLAGLAVVDYVTVFDELTPHALLSAIRPDLLVKGGTYSIDEVVGKEIVESYGGSVAVTRTVDGTSTSRILNRIHGLESTSSRVLQDKPHPRDCSTTNADVTEGKREHVPTCTEQLTQTDALRETQTVHH